MIIGIDKSTSDGSQWLKMLSENKEDIASLSKAFGRLITQGMMVEINSSEDSFLEVVLRIKLK